MDCRLIETSLDGSKPPKTDVVTDRCKSVEELRADKVLEIRKQLAEGQYDVNRGLNIIVDRILEGLLG